MNSWTRNDDNRIIDLYLEGNNIIDIAFLLNESTYFIKKRIIFIAKESIKNNNATIDDMCELFGLRKSLLKF
jgi:hypothetical protein